MSGCLRKQRLHVESLAVTCCPCVANVTNVCPERMLAKAGVYMRKGCSVCVAMPMMCVSRGCLWILHGGGVGGLNRVYLEAESCVLVWSLVQTISPSLYKCKNMELKGVRS